MTNDLVAKKAFENDQKIKELKFDLNKRWLNMAYLLYENKKEKYFKVLDYDTFESYIAQEELGFERSGVYRLIGIYEDVLLVLES